MRAQDIERYLADLGQQLQHMEIQQPVRILMVGGAFMLTQFHNRPTTNDVDVLLKDVDDPMTSSLYQTFKVAVRAVAARNQIPLTWINDVIGDFLRDTSVVPQGSLWRTYALLEVYIPPNEYIWHSNCLQAAKKIEGTSRSSANSYIFGPANRHSSWLINIFRTSKFNRLTT